LEDFGDSSFDYVIMTQTLQAVRHTEALLDEMLRVGRQGIVTFPNFGFWRCRAQVALQGLDAGRSKPCLSVVRHPECSPFHDPRFRAAVPRKHIDILQRMVLDHAHRPRRGPQFWPNLLGEIALYRLGRA
jgi:methionine biosynthesis protein MetW